MTSPRIPPPGADGHNFKILPESARIARPGPAAREGKDVVHLPIRPTDLHPAELWVPSLAGGDAILALSAGGHGALREFALDVGLTEKELATPWTLPPSDPRLIAVGEWLARQPLIATPGLPGLYEERAPFPPFSLDTMRGPSPRGSTGPVLDKLQPLSGKPVLDYGGAPGFFADKLAERGPPRPVTTDEEAPPSSPPPAV